MAVVNKSKTDHNRLGLAINLKYFQVDGKFPRHQHDVPGAVVEHIGKQLGISLSAYADYNFNGRMIKNHRADIRRVLGVRVGTADDGHNVMAWLTEHILPHNHRLEHLKEAALKRYQELKTEPPATKHLERLIRSALHTYTEHFCADILQRIPPAIAPPLHGRLTRLRRQKKPVFAPESLVFSFGYPNLYFQTNAVLWTAQALKKGLIWADGLSYTKVLFFGRCLQ